MKHSGRVRKLLARWVILTSSVSLLVFLAAGTTRLPSLRNYLAIFSTFLLATMIAIDPGLAGERARGCLTSGASERVSAGAAFLATLAVAAFEIGHLHSLPSVPVSARHASLALFAGAMALEMWAMVENPFFSPEVRLQSERGHKLVASGPYSLMRHPGYLAMLVAIPSSALAIGSWIALVPAAAFCGIIWKRVGKEEQFLLQNLAGYPEYLGKVRGRLLPRMEFRRHPRGNPSSGLASHASEKSRP
jgi:protein-S-isoprenylcysteine O-methyltransferase Ste14